MFTYQIDNMIDNSCILAISVTSVFQVLIIYTAKKLHMKLKQKLFLTFDLYITLIHQKVLIRQS